MTFSEVVQEAQQLNPEERLILAQLLLESLGDKPGSRNESSLTIFDMAGFLRPEGSMLTDEDIQAILVESLEEKYL